MDNVTKNSAFRMILPATATGTTTITATFDLQTVDGDGLTIFTTLGATNAGNFLKIGLGAVADGSDASDVLGSKIIPTGTGPIAVVYEVANVPGYRYVTLSVVRAGTTSTIGDVWAMEQSKTKPNDNNLGASPKQFSKFLYNPVLGTA